jgi:UDP-N-acetylglucosamine--N-acetylmuramyl-(pentapeptide) pyrophosphoryl-undecaprenol N-acetylglucosamine transferase
VPSPNVAEDHQTKNAAALVKNHAAILVADSDAESKLVDTVLSLLKDQQQSETLGINIGKMALPDADDIIAKEVLKLSR